MIGALVESLRLALQAAEAGPLQLGRALSVAGWRAAALQGGSQSANVRQQAGRIGGMLLTIHGLDYLSCRERILARLTWALTEAEELQEALGEHLAIPPVPPRHAAQIIPFPMVARA